MSTYKRDAMGDPFKEQEQKYRLELPKNTAVALRYDGKSFHTFTKKLGLTRPYDLDFMNAMDQATMHAMQTLGGAWFGYVQSDEISLFFTDMASEAAEMPFRGKVEKLASVGASAVSTSLYAELSKQSRWENIPLPSFDGRIAAVGDVEWMHQYLTWRRMDARRNAVMMAAQCLRSHKQLHGLGVNDMFEILQGTEFEKLPDGFFNGRLIMRVPEEGTAVVRGKTITFTRNRLVAVPALKETVDELLAIPISTCIGEDES